MRKCNLFKDHGQDGSHQFQSSPIPAVDDTYYLGENVNPFKAFKGVILKDTTDGKHYRIQVTNGTVEAIALD